MRTVIESLEVSEIVDAQREIYPRLDDAFDALRWWLSHDPESGEIIDDINLLYKQKGDPDQNIPALVVIYTFNDWQVLLMHILIQIPTL